MDLRVIILILAGIVWGGILGAGMAIAQDDLVELGNESYPFFVELLDVEFYPDSADVAYLTGVGGFLFVDISDMTNPRLLGKYGPIDIFERYYNGEARGSLAIGAAREDGLDFVDISNLRNPNFITRYLNNNYTYESVVFRGNFAYAAIRNDGMEIINISNPQDPRFVRRIVGFENAWDVFIDDRNLLYVADGPAGLKIFSLAQPDNPALMATISGSGASREVIVKNNRAFLACGLAGVDIIDVADPSAPQFLNNVAIGFGTVNHLDVDGDRLYAATWELVEIFDISDPLNPLLLGSEDTEVRAMGVAADNGRVLVADWWRLRTYSYTDAAAPDIQVRPVEYDFGFQGIGVPITRIFDIHNLGETALTISNIQGLATEFVVSPSSIVVPPGEFAQVSVTFTPRVAGGLSSFLQFHSDDPDEALKEIRVWGGVRRLAPGDSAIGFNLLDVNGTRHRLEDYRGKVVLLTFFASW